MVSQSVAKLFNVTTLTLLLVPTKKAAFAVTFSATTSIEPPEIETVPDSPSVQSSPGLGEQPG